jgi:surface polysaccharide O-acyltransferase-like enzyme
MQIQTRSGSAIFPAALTSDGGRLWFIDNIRWLMIVLVVMFHLSLTYGQVGDWYYTENRALDPASQIIFVAFITFTQAYFMGLLFLIAGYFAPGSYDKKGMGRFVLDRSARLGIPTLVHMGLLQPLITAIAWFFNPRNPMPTLTGYWHYIKSFQFVTYSGPLWFALALLIFTLLYAGIRRLLSFIRPSSPRPPRSTTVTHPWVILSIIVLAVISFFVRLVYPFGTSVFNMKLCFFPQYIFLFSVGIVAYRRNWFLNIPYSFGIAWFKMAWLVGIPFWIMLILLGGALTNMTPYYGGLYWQAAAYAFWESFFCIGICLGLLVLFREKFNRQGKIAGFLTRNAFAVYVFHAPILVGLTLLAREIPLRPLLKTFLMTLIVLPSCFGLSDLLRRIPLWRKVF